MADRTGPAAMDPEAAAAWSAAREMNPLETLMWRIEADPRLRSTITAVELLDSVPDWDRLVAAHDWATRMVPRARQRVVDPPLGLGAPTWVTDANFDLGYHLKRVRTPAPGTFRQVLDLAQQIAMQPFDRARPLWEAVLVEGLEGDRAAYFMKLHHSITDGLGGIQLIGLLRSRRREPTPDKPQPAPPEPESTTPERLLATQLARRARGAPAQAMREAGRALGLAGRLVGRPGSTLSDARRLVRSFERVAARPPARPSPLLSGRSLSWRFLALDVPLDDLKAAGKAGGGSLNDAYLAALLGGLRRYHERLGVEIEELPIAVPISLRAGDNPMGGNRFAGARFAAPIGVPDPGDRIALIREFVLTARDEAALDFLGFAAPALARVPPPVLARVARTLTAAQDLQASNVAGVPYPVYMAGARIERLYPFGPLPGCAIMAALVSHCGTCCIGINVDPAAVTEPELFETCMREGFDEVLALIPARHGDGRPTAAPPARTSPR